MWIRSPDFYAVLITISVSGADPSATATDADGPDGGAVQVRPLRPHQPYWPVQAHLGSLELEETAYFIFSRQ